MSAIKQETGGSLREERAVDGKLKSHLEWPKSSLWFGHLSAHIIQSGLHQKDFW